MRHAVLGAGGVGAFLGAALARAGREVLLVMRDESLPRYDGFVRVESEPDHGSTFSLHFPIPSEMHVLAAFPHPQ